MSDLIPISTPVGPLHWVNISGQGKLNYNEDGYDYTATVYLPTEKAQPLIDRIIECLGDAGDKKVKGLGYKELHKDEEGNLFSPTEENKGEPSGIFAFQFKTNTTFADGKKKDVNVFDAGKVDADCKVIQRPQKVNLGDRRIGNESLGAISGKMKRYDQKKECGVSLFLHAIQLTKFVEYVDGGGFEAQEGEFDGASVEGSSFEAPAAEPKAKEEPKATSKPRL